MYRRGCNGFVAPVSFRAEKLFLPPGAMRGGRRVRLTSLPTTANVVKISRASSSSEGRGAERLFALSLSLIWQADSVALGLACGVMDVLTTTDSELAQGLL